MIKISNAPKSVTELYTGTIELDKVYEFTVEKTIADGAEPYKVLEVTVKDNHNETIDPIIVKTVSETIKNWGKKNGIGKSSREE